MKAVKKTIVILITCLICLYLMGFRFTQQAKLEINNGEALAFSHRGLSNYSPENSEEAFVNAERLGFNALEIDILLTKDGVPVLFHDENSKKLLGIDTNIIDVDYSFLKDKHLFFEGEKTQNKILSLGEFITEFQKENIVYTDIKIPSKQLADSIVSSLQRSGNYETTLIADANIFFLAYLKMKDSKVRTVLEGFNKGKEWTHYFIPHKYRPDFYASFLSEVDDDHVSFLKRNKLLKNKIVYGVDKTNLHIAIDFGLQNVIIDFDSTLLDSQHIIQLLDNKSKE